MKYPIPSIIFDRKKKSSDTSTGIVEIRVTHQRLNKYFSTGVKILPSQWDATKKCVTGHKNSTLLNTSIESLYHKIKTALSEMAIAQTPFSFSGLESKIEKSVYKGSFIDYAENKIQNRKDITESTRRTQNKLIGTLKEFGLMLNFSDLTQENVRKFDYKLHERNYTQSTVHSYHKFLKIYINEALREGLIEKSPYSGIKIERGTTGIRKYLTKKELQIMEQAHISSPTIDRVRDLFLFQCYTGLAYAELESFSYSNLEERDGKFILSGRRKKTGEGFYIVILPEALAILEKYNRQLPIITNQQYNLRLKTLAEIINLNKNLTSHMARHTFAVNTLNSGIPIEVVARMLGHTNTATTHIYAKILDKTVEEAFEKLSKK